MRTGILLPPGAILIRTPQLAGSIVNYEEVPHSNPKRAAIVTFLGSPILKNALLAGPTAHVHWCPEHVALTLRKFMVLDVRGTSGNL